VQQPSAQQALSNETGFLQYARRTRINAGSENAERAVDVRQVRAVLF